MKTKQTIQGLYTVVVTPFNDSLLVDEKAFRRNLQEQIEHKVDGIVVLGTTGESPTLTSKEKDRIVEIALEEVRGKNIPIMAGTGSYSTQQTIENTLRAEQQGADMALIVSPYYNKPTQEGTYRHYKAIADAVSIPIMIYSVQGRTGQNIQVNTLKRLADIPRIVGVKEASGNIDQIGEVIELIGRHRPDFSVMSGDDALTFPVMALGGNGVLSVVSNLIPKPLKEMVYSLQKGDYQTARELHFKYLPLFRGAFIESNPIPIKAAMNRCGKSVGSCRLPLCDMSPENALRLDQILKSLELGPGQE